MLGSIPRVATKHVRHWCNWQHAGFQILAFWVQILGDVPNVREIQRGSIPPARKAAADELCGYSTEIVSSEVQANDDLGANTSESQRKLLDKNSARLAEWSRRSPAKRYFVGSIPTASSKHAGLGERLAASLTRSPM